MFLLKKKKQLEQRALSENVSCFVEFQIVWIMSNFIFNIIPIDYDVIYMYNESMKEYFFKAIIESCEEGGFSAYVPSLPGCVSEGETYEQCFSNIKEATELYLETAQEKGIQIGEEKAHITEMCVTV